MFAAALFWTFALGMAAKLKAASADGFLSVYFKGSGSRVVSRIADPAGFEFEFNLALAGLAFLVLAALVSTWFVVKLRYPKLGNPRELDGNAL